jgi:cytochrome c551
MKAKYHIALLAILSGCFFSCSRSSDGKQVDSQKFERYYLQGKQLYTRNCSNCHQENGTGLGRVYPPLAPSDFMKKNIDEVLCIIRHGREGKLIVNGISFNQKMPANQSLTDLEVAEIATYIFNTWGNEKGIFEVNKVRAVLDSCTIKP